MFIDAHCHLEQQTFGDELAAVIERAFAAGLTHMIVVGASGVTRGADEAIALAQAHGPIYAAVGIHPHEAAQANDADIARIETLLDHPKVVCLGETGLDYYYDNSPRDVQRRVFAQLLEVGKRKNLPVMLHVRDAHADCLASLDAVGLPERGGVVHCFTGGPQEAQAYLDRGLHLSIPGVVTFNKATQLQQAVRSIPLGRLLLETDCPYLAPVPYRGKRNEPAYVVATAAAVGKLKGLCAVEMGEIARANTLRIFGIPEAP